MDTIFLQFTSLFFCRIITTLPLKLYDLKMMLHPQPIGRTQASFDDTHTWEVGCAVKASLSIHTSQTELRSLVQQRIIWVVKHGIDSTFLLFGESK